MKERLKSVLRSKKLLLVAVVLFVLAAPIFALGESPVAVQSVIDRIQGRSSNGLTLSWIDNGGSDHLSLDPVHNIRQEHRLELAFTPPGEGVFLAGEIEIRLPRALFENRNGNLIVGNIAWNQDNPPAGSITPANLPHMIIPLPGDTDFIFVIDSATDEVVITNFRSVSGETTHLRVEVAVNYLPSQSPNGFSNEFVAHATFADVHDIDPIESNNLSLDLTTRIAVHSSSKTVVHSQPVWQGLWGVQPPGFEDHFFVRYRIHYEIDSMTTQPFVAFLQDTPLDGGEIVAWSTHVARNQNPLIVLNGTTNFTVGTTATYNDSSLRTQNIVTPVGNPNTSSRDRWWQDIVVAYPRDGSTEQLVRNAMEVTVTPADDSTFTLNEEAGYVFSEIYLNYEGDAFNIRKWIDPDAPSGPGWRERVATLNSLEAGDNVYLVNHGTAQSPGTMGGGNVSIGPQSSIRAEARGFSFTENGTQPFTTTAIDDRVYLRTSGGVHLLEPEDYRFVQVRIGHYRETTPVVRNGNLLATQTVANVDRSPIDLYYKTPAEGWQPLATHNPTAALLGNWINLPNADVSRIKAVHDNGRYMVEFDLQFIFRLNSTPHVRSIIENHETVDVVNFAAMIIEDHEGTIQNLPEAESYSGLPVGMMDLDIHDYGHLVQRSFHSSILARTSYFSRQEKVIRTNPGIFSDNTNSRVVLPYRVAVVADLGLTGASGDQRTRPSNALLPDLLPEQREGVFYDLLPQGTVLNPASIVARDAMGRTVEHSVATETNWQGSGRTLVRIYVSATAGPNYRNVPSPATWQGADWWLPGPAVPLISGTGFTIDFDVFYPWANVPLFGTSIRNIASYQSRSGPFLSPVVNGQPHTNSDNTAANLTAQERQWMSNFPDTGMLDADERNTRSAAVAATINPVVAEQIGFSKLVRSATGLDYGMQAQVRPGGAYSYRLHYSTGLEQATDLVLFDILEAADDGRPSWRGNLQSIDLTHPISLGAAPVVYFSTQIGLDPSNNPTHADLGNTARWTTTEPADLSTVTAIAIDLSLRDNGQPFILTAGSGVVVNLHMQAPHGQTSGTHAFNRALYSVTSGGTPQALAQTPYTQVQILERGLALTKTSDPASGTQVDPVLVERGSTVTYAIVIENVEEAALANIVLQDVIPQHMSFAASELRGHFGTAAPTPLADIARIDYSVSGNTVGWTISTLGAGESFTLIVPAVVAETLPGETTFANTARITHLGAVAYDIPSNATFHRALPFVLPTGVTAGATVPVAALAIVVIAVLTTYFAVRARKRIEELSEGVQENNNL
ncbi:MAG: DUF11 domain-containing protein [Coriobacteriia bacterium]|nr:DUF11 domain-containing protein [Coriobacteriia bacterium]MCL2870415.1 DUF11 domain-containing protein [Coriobacteriia bacterium]